MYHIRFEAADVFISSTKIKCSESFFHARFEVALVFAPSFPDIREISVIHLSTHL